MTTPTEAPPKPKPAPPRRPPRPPKEAPPETKPMDFDPLIAVAIVILSGWTLILLWGTWEIKRMIRTLDDERRELRRWVRLRTIYKNQSDRWL